MKSPSIVGLFLLCASGKAWRRPEDSDMRETEKFGSSVEFGNSAEFSPTSPTSRPPPSPPPTTASPRVVFPTKRVRKLYREQDRNSRTSSWSSWSQNPGHSTTDRRKSTGRSRNSVEDSNVRTSSWSSWSPSLGDSPTVRRQLTGRPRNSAEDRNIRMSSWSSWSQKPGHSTTVRRPSTGRSRSPVEGIVVFPCQEAAMRCEYRPRDTDYPYRCKWTQLPQTPAKTS